MPSALAGLNSASVDDAAHTLGEVCASRSWIGSMLAERPYGAPENLYSAADRAIAGLTVADLQEAIDGHAVIGRPRADDPKSAREQSGVDTADNTVLAGLRAGNIAYKNRFGRVFLICATGRSAVDMLTELLHRLDNDPAEEWEVTREELRKINRLRLEGLASS
jgi:2-oxo-4-hydroxy-4-carboxy-5-ureidoimidazoline decarboxylase